MSDFIPHSDRETYCARCDMYFISEQQRSEHVQSSSNHPRCKQCDRRFLNKKTLSAMQHLTYSRYHNYCASCEIDFRSPAASALNRLQHIETAAVHCDDSDDEGEDDAELAVLSNHPEEWEDEMGELKYPETDLQDPQQLEVKDVDVLRHFACPMCHKYPAAICRAPCGHIFCPPCITRAYECTDVCPICLNAGDVGQLRKIFLA
ncbi:hypothetical protein B0H10DRAFT_2163883 [Mycena sp. CBHHK59/15]|nr:hypothetical protein B0H10DRAFT_2163883 [Mycena sp. CBHHK59/15]